MTTKPSVLFVDDQNNVLQGFKRALRSLEESWTIQYATGGKEALKLIEAGHVDIVISDTNMPGMRGTELLKEVQTNHPEMIRLVLSGGGSRSDDISTLLRTSHQFFAKPFETERLKTLVTNLLDVREKAGDDKVRKLVASISRLPCAPFIYDAFKKERENTSSDLDKLGNYIAQDPSLTAKMLQSLNSAFFGVNKAGIHPFIAAQSMGPGTISYLFDEESASQTVAKDHPNYNFLATVYKNSLHCALLMDALANAENMADTSKNIAYVTGMLSNVGSIILAYEMADAYAKIVPNFKSPATQAAAEKKTFGASHDAAGAYFQALWGFPAASVRATANMLTPDKDSDQTLNLTTLLHVAYAFAQTEDFEAQKALLNMPYLEKVGAASKLQQWHDLDKEVRQKPALRNWQFG